MTYVQDYFLRIPQRVVEETERLAHAQGMSREDMLLRFLEIGLVMTAFQQEPQAQVILRTKGTERVLVTARIKRR